jgi:hypothetical protein
VTHTALVLPVPEAERVVRQLRERYDPSARAGLFAHITLLTPFATEWEGLDGFFAGFAPFSFELTRTGRFPGTLYLAPEPVAPFVGMIEGLGARYPDHPAYGGEFDEIVPHLTVAHHPNEASLDAIAMIVKSALPIVAYASSVLLMQGSNENGWREVGRFRLSGA